MKSRSGLKKVTKTVRGKRGSTQRAYWVRASAAESRKGNRTIDAAYMLRNHGLQIVGRGLAVGAATHTGGLIGSVIGMHAGAAIGNTVGGRAGTKLGIHIGSAIGGGRGVAAARTHAEGLATSGRRYNRIIRDVHSPRATRGAILTAAAMHIASRIGGIYVSSALHRKYTIPAIVRKGVWEPRQSAANAFRRVVQQQVHRQAQRDEAARANRPQLGTHSWATPDPANRNRIVW